jgi:hypothetical protein
MGMCAEMASFDVRQLARGLQAVFDAHPEPTVAVTIYLDDRYRGPVTEDGDRLHDPRRQEALDAGYRAAVEFERTFRRLSFPLFRDNAARERRFEQGRLDAQAAGARAYLLAFATADLAEIADRRTLKDLGTYLGRLAADVLGTNVTSAVIREVLALGVGNPGLVDRLAAVLLGLARDRGHDTDAVVANRAGVFDELTTDLPLGLKEALRVGVLAVRDQEAREGAAIKAAVAAARRARYAQVAALLARAAEDDAMDRDQTLDLVAQTLIRTSEGRYRLNHEFRDALNERSSDSGFAADLERRIAALRAERRSLRNNLDWNASSSAD